MKLHEIIGLACIGDANPLAGLVQGSDGNFYRTTEYGGMGNYGTMFLLNVNGTLTSLYSFTNGTHGCNPNGLAQSSDRDSYGTTYGGGKNNRYGTLSKISATARETIQFNI
jgi:uncharacterized repeat protein (TIGR03803 family)